jgi:hypothetical protein
VQVPVATIVIVEPFVPPELQTDGVVVVEKVTVKPELAVALTVNGALPYTLFESALNVIVCDVVVMSNVLLVAPVSEPLNTVSVYPVPPLLIERSENVATPPTAATVFVPDNVPPRGLDPIATVTFAVEEVRFPNWSSIRTVTAGLIAAPAAVFDGCCKNPKCVAAPGVMLNVVLSASVRPELVARST